MIQKRIVEYELILSPILATDRQLLSPHPLYLHTKWPGSPYFVRL